METYHLIVGAKASSALVRDDDDRRALLRCVEGALGALLLAYCVMDTHLHLVAEGPEEHLRRWLDGALADYARAFNRRHRGEALLLRGPVEAIRKLDACELARAIHYVHENPCRGERPIADRAIDFPWSSARAFAGLSLAPFPNVERANALMAAEAWRALKPRDRIELADVEPVAVPFASPGLLVASAAEAYRIAPAQLPSAERGDTVIRARALYLRLGKLEAYTASQLAPFLGRSEAQCSRIAASQPVGDQAVAVARTTVREWGMRKWLVPTPLPARRPSAQMQGILASGPLSAANRP